MIHFLPVWMVHCLPFWPLRMVKMSRMDKAKNRHHFIYFIHFHLSISSIFIYPFHSFEMVKPFHPFQMRMDEIVSNKLSKWSLNKSIFHPCSNIQGKFFWFYKKRREIVDPKDFFKLKRGEKKKKKSLKKKKYLLSGKLFHIFKELGLHCSRKWVWSAFSTI